MRCSAAFFLSGSQGNKPLEDKVAAPAPVLNAGEGDSAEAVRPDLSTRVGNQDDFEEKLAGLVKMKADGLLDEEFRTVKRRLLGMQ